MADVKPKFVAGMKVIHIENNIYSLYKNREIITIDKVKLYDNYLTSVYIVSGYYKSNVRVPIRYIDIHYKLLLGSLLTLL